MFYDSETGEIVEADIAINPRPLGADGTLLQFSTDGTPGTYDLESTLMHEIGHFLGLDHSNVIGSTMQPHQGLNGTYGLPAFTERTLSEDDRSRVLSLYGPTESMKDGMGAIEGKLTNSSLGGYPVPLPGAHVWVEESGSGRVVASGITSASGNYRIESIPAGQYRVLTEYVDGPTVAEASSTSMAVSPDSIDSNEPYSLAKGFSQRRTPQPCAFARRRHDQDQLCNGTAAKWATQFLSRASWERMAIFQQRPCPLRPGRN